MSLEFSSICIEVRTFKMDEYLSICGPVLCVFNVLIYFCI